MYKVCTKIGTKISTNASDLMNTDGFIRKIIPSLENPKCSIKSTLSKNINFDLKGKTENGHTPM